MTIRVATSRDAQAISELNHQLGYPTSPAEAQARLSSLQSRDDHAVFVAERANAVVGWIHVFVIEPLVSAPFAEVGGLVVAEAHRGAGIGGQLMSVAERWASERGLGELRVRSNVVRGDAHDFYEGLGYRRVKSQAVFARSLAAGERASRGGPTLE